MPLVLGLVFPLCPALALQTHHDGKELLFPKGQLGSGPAGPVSGFSAMPTFEEE